VIISKEIEFDMGHRIPHHKSKCRSPHGHRYKLIVYLMGDVLDLEGESDHGMVMDFSDIKKILMEEIDEQFDHAFVYWEKDEALCDFYEKEDHFKSVKVSFTPTVENLAGWFFHQLHVRFMDTYGNNLTLNAVELFETPTCKAVCHGLED